MLYIIEMPEIKSCKNCSLKKVHIGHGEYIEYCGLNAPIFCNDKERPKECPLVPINGPTTIQELNESLSPRKVMMSFDTFENLKVKEETVNLVIDLVAAYHSYGHKTAIEIMNDLGIEYEREKESLLSNHWEFYKCKCNVDDLPSCIQVI